MTLPNTPDGYGSISMGKVGHVLIGGSLLLHATAWAAEALPPVNLVGHVNHSAFASNADLRHVRVQGRFELQVMTTDLEAFSYRHLPADCSDQDTYSKPSSMRL